MENNLKPATVAVAFRNNGKVAPITVRFTQDKDNLAADLHSRMILRSIGINSKTTQSVLMSYTEDMFNEDFAEFGITADMIVNGYRDSDGVITAHEINLSTSDVYGQPLYIARYETTNTLEATNEDGSVKAGWSIKQVNGQELTHEGALIYSTFVFTEDGVDQKLQHDQNLSKKKATDIEENQPAKKKEAVKDPF